MAPAVEHRQYHPGRENVPLSVAVREAIEPTPRHVYTRNPDGTPRASEQIGPQFNRHWFDELKQHIGVGEAIEEHESTSVSADEFDLYDHVDPDALDNLFRETDDVGIIVQFHLTNVIVSVWSDGAIDIRVTDDLERQVPG